MDYDRENCKDLPVSPMTIAETRKKANEALSRVIQPVRLERKSAFRFRCHPGVPCFTRCCRNMNIS